jgi:cleavage and polyadenylation specificity factor subunit 1
MQEEVQATCFFAPKGIYAVATSEQVFFKLEDDDYHHEWANEGTAISSSPSNSQRTLTTETDTTFLPSIDQATLKLLHPKGWSIIDT